MSEIKVFLLFVYFIWYVVRGSEWNSHRFRVWSNYYNIQRVYDIKIRPTWQTFRRNEWVCVSCVLFCYKLFIFVVTFQSELWWDTICGPFVWNNSAKRNIPKRFFLALRVCFSHGYNIGKKSIFSKYLYNTRCKNRTFHFVCFIVDFSLIF